MSHIFKLFAQSSEATSLNTAVIFQKDGKYESLDYAALHQKSLIFGNFLRNTGVHPGDKVGVILENQPEYPIAFFAIMYTGGVSVPLDIQFSPEQIKQVLMQCEAEVLIVTKKIYHKFKKFLYNIKFIVIDSQEFQKELEGVSSEEKFNAQERGRDEIAVLFYTSGTTDNPKAVMLTHNNLLANVHSLEQLNIVNQHDSVVSLLPLHHAYSFTVTLLIPLLSGASIVYPPGITSIDLLSCLQKTSPTIFVGVPQVFSLIHHSINEKLKSLPLPKKFIALLLKNIFYICQQVFYINFNKYLFNEMHKRFGGNLRFMVSGGARLNPEIARDFVKWGFIILEGYGLTETSPVSAFNPVQKAKIGSVGKPIPQVEIKIIQKNKNNIGEIVIKGSNVMTGYYKMQEQTKEAIKEEWFHSGDLGYFDREGYLFLTGRKKELIVLSSGKNINPEEVEEHYSRCPFIKEICVLETKSEGSAEKILVAIVVADEEYFKDQQVTTIYDKLKWELDNLSIELPTYKRIHGFMISKEALPRTRLGKLMRYKGQQLYNDLLNSSKPEKKAYQKENIIDGYSGLYQSAMTFLQGSLKRKINIDDHLELDFGLDSLGKVELLMSLQEALELDISEDIAMDFFMSNTVKELLENLKKIFPQGESSAINKDAEVETKNSRPIVWKELLEEPLAPEILSKIRLIFTPVQIGISLFLIVLFKLVFSVFFLLKIEGEKNLKNEGPYLICPNHTSYLDGLLILSALPFSVALKTYFLGDSRFFERFLLKPFMKTAHLIPIELNFNLVDALKSCVFVLKNSKIICYFPEGQRSIDGEVKNFKKGIAILIKELNIPAMPVYIKGAFHAWPRGRRFPRLAPIKVKFGEMLKPTDLTLDFPQEDCYETIAENLQKQVIRLKNSQNT